MGTSSWAALAGMGLVGILVMVVVGILLAALVLSVSFRLVVGSMPSYLRAVGAPVLISEFHFGSDDRGPFGKGVVSVWNEQLRGEAYAKFIAAAAESPDIVGAHWFQYNDQPVTGRLLDGENSHIGLVGITDIPFGGFVETVRDANLRIGNQ